MNNFKMKILIVDDSKHIHTQLQVFLAAGGYLDLNFVSSALDAFKFLGINENANVINKVDLILMDVEMEEIDGIYATQQIKKIPEFYDIPIIMVTADTSPETLNNAFEAGAIDYLTKPIRKVELLARVKSFLKLKFEIDSRKVREAELIKLTHLLERTNVQLNQANDKLLQISILDSLTDIFNRRYFDEIVVKEWKRLTRSASFLSIIMIDIDFFKAYNDTYGHQMGDKCLTLVASCLKESLGRPVDLVARYGGEEFVVILPNTDISGASVLAKKMMVAVEELKISHTGSKINDYVTISLGIAGMIPTTQVTQNELIAQADQALYLAKNEGRNRYVIYQDETKKEIR